MANPPTTPDDYAPFAALPVRYITGSHGNQRLAVHVSGRFTVNQPPLICVPGYTRNMSDFTDFLRLYRASASVDWPIVLVDLAGRGRSSYRKKGQAYSTVQDAHDLSTLARALGISEAIFVGQGHGGQVIMALAASHPALIAGAVLINSGPTTNPRGLVRLRSNMRHLAAARGVEQFQLISRQILGTEYPGLPDAALDALATRSHFVDNRGRVKALFDEALLHFLDGFSLDDVFEPQWHLFNALRPRPLMLARTQLTDRLSNATFAEMIARQLSAKTVRFTGEGSPALLNNDDEVGAIADFVSEMDKKLRQPNDR